MAERGKEEGRIVLLYFLLLSLRLKSNRKLIMYKYYIILSSVRIRKRKKEDIIVIFIFAINQVENKKRL